MKKALLIASFICISVISQLYGQVLTNTAWRFRPAVVTTLEGLLGPLDSVRMEFSNPNIFSVKSYVGGVASTGFMGFYGESGNTLFLTDTMTSAGSPCIPTDTGRYNFVIVDTILTLSNANEDCPIRASFLLGDFYGQNNIGLGFEDNPNIFEFSVYPNPVADWLQLNESFSTIKILDMTGKIIRQFKNMQTIPVQDLADGLYLIGVEKQGKWCSKKLMKQ